jgi:uncharacterized SAM-binding protein YcdF (DUF218 family)
MQRLRRWLALAALIVLVTAAVALVGLDARVRAYLAGPPLGGTRVYAMPTVLRPGGTVPGGSLPRLLTRLGYRQGGDAALEPGEFQAAEAAVELVQRP